MTNNLDRTFTNNDAKNVKRLFGGVIAVWLIAALASIGLTVAFIWAIVALVSHYT